MIEIAKQLKNYKASYIKNDLFAAITVTITLVPQGMAYALLAGLPPIYGLYAAFIPLLIYPLFGSSRQLSVGPVALVSIIMLSALSLMAEPGSPEYIQLAILTALVAGLIQVMLAIFRMGWLVNYLSEPVIVGFTSAAALIIVSTQLKSLLGLEIPREIRMIDMLKSLMLNIQNISWISLTMGVLSILIIFFLKRIKRAIPGALIAVVLGILSVIYFNLDEYNIAIVGAVPKGLPVFDVSFFVFEDIVKVFPLASIICLISFIESLAISKTIASRYQDDQVDSNKELLGLGLAKVAGSFFQAFPSTGSFTRSAINEQAGSQSGLSSIFAGALIGITLLFLTPYFYHLPKPVLAAIIISAVTGLVNIPYARKLLKIDRKDFYVLLTTFVITILLGVQRGVLAGVVLSVVMVLYKSSRPHYAVLGRLEGTTSYRNLKRYSDAITQSKTLIIRYDDDIYFGNAEHFYDKVNKEVRKVEGIEKLILDFSSINNIDSTALQILERLFNSLKRQNIKIILSGAIGPVRDYMKKSGLIAMIGEENTYLRIHDAVSEEDENSKSIKKKYPTQHF
ncbi:MAG: solute carrier family 26 protein [Chitinophagales bacterium]|nr:solute carrier family 26 protein [Chitinophagales bacterium]